MYNGIGLATARGSGTNGYVQKNLSYVKPRYEPVAPSASTAGTLTNKPANKDILMHDKKRRVELKCLELKERLLEKGEMKLEDVEMEVAKLKTELLEELKESGRNVELLREKEEIQNYDIHHLAERKEEEMKNLATAFGIDERGHVEGSAFDPVLQQERKQKRLLEREQRLRTREIVREERQARKRERGGRDYERPRGRRERSVDSGGRSRSRSSSRGSRRPERRRSRSGRSYDRRSHNVRYYRSSDRRDVSSRSPERRRRNEKSRSRSIERRNEKSRSRSPERRRRNERSRSRSIERRDVRRRRYERSRSYEREERKNRY